VFPEIIKNIKPLVFPEIIKNLKPLVFPEIIKKLKTFNPSLYSIVIKTSL
jgi:hypothetical protein